MYAGKNKLDLTKDTVYTHPSSIQCNASNEISSLKSSVSNGKQLVANAITGKGVATSSSDTFATMASNIGRITSTISCVHSQSYTMSSGTYVDAYDMAGKSYAVILYYIYRSNRFYACSAYYFANNAVSLITAIASNQNNLLPVKMNGTMLQVSQGHTDGTSGPQTLNIYA